MPKLFSQDKYFNNLLKGSSFNAVATAFGVGFGFVATLLIARNYGSDLIGNVATITSTFTLLSLVALLGNQTLALKVLPEHIEKYSYSVAQHVYHKLLVITSWFTCGVIAIWLLIEKGTPLTFLRNLEQYIYLVAILIVLSVFRELNTKTLRGLGDYKIYSLFELLPPILLATTAVFAIGLKVPEHLFQYIYFLPLAIAGLLSFIFVIRTFDVKSLEDSRRTSQSIPLPSKTTLIRTSLPMLGITLSNVIISNFDILMLNYFTSSSVVGVYSIYVKIVGITALATHSINAMFGPTVSKLFSSNEASQLKSFSKKATLLSFTATFGTSFVLILFLEPLLGLFGQEFIEDKRVLYVLIVSTLAGSFFGSVGFYLNMTGHQAYFFRIMICAAVMNVCLNMILIPLWGPMGAAAATLISVVTWNLLATRKIFKEYKYTLIWSGNHNA